VKKRSKVVFIQYQNVWALEVKMNDVFAVKIRQTTGDSTHDLEAVDAESE